MFHLNKLAIAIVCLSPVLAISSVSASELKYDYVELGGSFGKTELNILGKRADFSSKSLNATFQYSPSEGIYIKAFASRLKVDDDANISAFKAKTDSTSTAFGAVIGLYTPLADNIDFRAGIGATRENNDFSSTLTLGSVTSAQKTRRNDTSLYVEAGLKIGLDDWGDFDLLFSRENDANYFTVDGNLPLSESLGLDVGYTYSPDGKDRERFGTWNLGVRYYF
ncbi:MAG: hypothetical protein ACPGUD_08380 [Parashewanella sp.]